MEMWKLVVASLSFGFLGTLGLLVFGFFARWFLKELKSCSDGMQLVIAFGLAFALSVAFFAVGLLRCGVGH